MTNDYITEEKKKLGRPPIEHTRKKMSITLPMPMVLRLRETPGSQSVIIERALCGWFKDMDLIKE